MSKQAGSGTGQLRSGQRDLGFTHYEIHVGLPNKPATVVELESPPVAQDGEILELMLEDGRVLQLQVCGVSPYCRVLGERPIAERRRADSDTQLTLGIDHGRRRSDGRTLLAIHHPCPRCMATEALVTHRGVMMTTLHCTACRHDWGVPPAVVAAATRTDRRTIARPEAFDRRGTDRPAPPTCSYCSTDAYVHSTRRTAEEIFFCCYGCQAMFAVPRPRPNTHHRSAESR